LFLVKYGGGFAAAILLSGVSTVLFARLATSEFPIAVKVNDIWGAFATGFAVQLFGYPWFRDRVMGAVGAAPAIAFGPTGLKLSDVKASRGMILVSAKGLASDAKVVWLDNERVLEGADWRIEIEPGLMLGEKTTAIASAGLYVPSGKGSFPSVLVQIGTPAIVAGVPEIAVVGPELLVCLGATAAQALLGSAFRVTKQRGEFIQRPGLPLTMATVHPSSILRAPDEESRQVEMRAFIHDLRLVAERLNG